MKLTDIISTRVVTIAMDDSLKDIKEIFEQVSFHHLLVVGHEDKLVGVISDRDLLKSLNPYLGTVAVQKRDLACLKKRAHQIMNRDLVCAKLDESIDDIVKKFKEHAISCVPIIDEDDVPVAIVTWHDLLKTL